MNENLKLCPFCGNDSPHNHNISGAVWCDDCHSVSNDHERWNTRPLEDALRARAEAAEAQLQVVANQLKAQMEQWKQDCKRAEAAEARVKELDLLLREAIGGAAWESCEYKDYEIAIPTWHCCDWSEWVREVAEKLGIKLPQPPQG